MRAVALGFVSFVLCCALIDKSGAAGIEVVWQDPEMKACRDFPKGEGLERAPGRPVSVKLGDHRFIIPWCYQKPFHENRCVEGCDGIALEFWIPSLDPTEMRLVPGLGVKPLETKRPVPGPDEWAIEVISLRPIPADADQGYTSVDKIIGNLTSQFGEDLRLTPDRGLTRIEDVNAPVNVQHWFERTADHNLFVRCFADEPFDETVCSSKLELKRWGLYAEFRMRGGALAHHDVVIDGLSKLLATWKQ